MEFSCGAHFLWPYWTLHSTIHIWSSSTCICEYCSSWLFVVPMRNDLTHWKEKCTIFTTMSLKTHQWLMWRRPPVHPIEEMLETIWSVNVLSVHCYGTSHESVSVSCLPPDALLSLIFISLYLLPRTKKTHNAAAQILKLMTWLGTIHEPIYSPSPWDVPLQLYNWKNLFFLFFDRM